MASQNLNVGTSANSNDGDTLRAAFIKLKQMFAEVYGQTYSEQGDLSGTDFKINESKLQLTASAVAGDDGKVLTYDHATGGFSWEDAFTGTIGDITGIVAGDGLTGSSLSSDEATINVVAGTGITVAADSVSLATSVQDEITANTAKVGITATQAGHITANNAKVSDQTVTLTDGGNVTITGTYPDFTLSSPDVVGAVDSVNGDTGVVVLDTLDIAENTNLYYTEARVSANTDVAANTAKTGITSGQAGEITANTLKVGITTAQAGEITANNAKLTNATHTGDVTGDGALTIADDVVTAAKLDVSNTGADGQILQYNADGTMTWVTGVTGDITSVATGDGLTGGDTSGDVTISLDATVAGDGLTLSSGVLSVDTIQTGDVADDAITSPKLAEFDDTFTAGTTGDIIVSNGTDFIHATMSGDATIVAGGAITIADDAVDADKLADSINTDIAAGVAKVSNVTTDLTITGTTDARTIVSSDGTDAIIPVASTTESGLMSKTIFDEHEVNKAKAAGTVTNLTKTVSGTGFSINSSDGTDVELSLADTNNWGLMSDEMFDQFELNTSKLSNSAHTGDVTGTADSTALTIADDAVTYAKIQDVSATDRILGRDSAGAGVVEEITPTNLRAMINVENGANAYAHPNHTGDVTSTADGATVIATDAVTTLKIADANVTTAKILDDNVTHDKLEDRYTAVVSVTPAATYTLDWSTGAVFVMSADISQNIEFDFTNYKAGQTIDIYKLKGAYSITFDSDAATSETFNKCGGVDYAGASTNLIQVQCVDDSANAVFNYAVSAYVGDTTPS